MSTLYPDEYMWVLLDGDQCLSALFSLDWACASATTLRAEMAVCARSANIAREILGPRKYQSEGKSPGTNAEGATPSGQRASLQALTARLSKNSFFSLG